MLRRTKRDTFLGRDIIDLPKTSVHTFYVEFSPLERKIYDLIFNRCQARLIWDSENGNLNKGRILGYVFSGDCDKIQTLYPDTKSC